MNVNYLLCAYRNYLNSKGLSSSSITRYTNIVKRFTMHCRRIDDLTKKAPYYSFFKESERDSSATLNLKKTAIKHFAYMLKEKLGLNCNMVFAYKRYSRLPIIPSTRDLNLLPLILKHGNLNDQQRLAIKLVINHGLSSKDIVALDMKNVLSPQVLIISRNSMPDIHLSLSYDQSCLLLRHIQSRAIVHTTTDALFIGKTGKRIDNRYIAYILARINSLYNTKFTVTKLRNQFIVDCMDSGIDEIYIAAYMGTKSLKHLYRYRCYSKKAISQAQRYITKERGELPK